MAKKKAKKKAKRQAKKVRASSSPSAEEKEKQKQADKPEADRRRDEIFRLLMSGNTSGAIVQKCSSEWGVTERQVFKYLKTAREKLKQLMETDYPTIIEEAVAIYDQIIQKALIEGEEKYTADGLRYVTHDLHAAKAALTDKMKLLGHFTNKVKVIKGISDEDREAFGSWETQELEQYVN